MIQVELQQKQSRYKSFCPVNPRNKHLVKCGMKLFRNAENNIHKLNGLFPLSYHMIKLVLAFRDQQSDSI